MSNNMLKHQADFNQLFPNDDQIKLIDTSNLIECEVVEINTTNASK